MVTLIVIFYLSFLLMTAMLLAKRRELATGNTFFFSRVAEKSDHVFHKLHDDILEIVSYFNKHTFIAFLQWIAAQILSWLRNLYIRLFHLAHKNPHSKKVIDMVRGKGEVKGTLHGENGASFFLKKISDDSIGSDLAAGKETTSRIE